MEEEKAEKLEVDEIEVFEGRFKATKDEIAKVTDNFIKNHYFDGLDFLAFIIGWDDGRRVYYGKRKDETTRGVTTITLGYIEVTQLKRLSDMGVRVRIVCIWPPLLKYWEELPKALESIFPTIEKLARIQGENGEELFDLTLGKPGRKSDPDYDTAYKRLQDGEEYDVVFKWYCEKSELDMPNEYDRNRFKVAMKYRENKS